MTKQVPLKLIGKTKTPYIRKKTDEDYVQELVEVTKTTKTWPFPPIILTHAKKAVGEAVYEIVDGFHRFAVAIEVKAKTIPAEVIGRPADDGEIVALQMKYNLQHGMRLEKDDRDRAIKIMRDKYSMKLDSISRLTGLDLSSVSRISRNLQRKTKEQKAAGKAERAAPRDYDPNSWFTLLSDLNSEAFNKMEELATYFQSHKARLNGIISATQQRLQELQGMPGGGEEDGRQ